MDNIHKIKAAPWTGVFIKEAKFVGYTDSMWGSKGRELLALGRTAEEAIELSKNKLSIDGIWRLNDYIKAEKNERN
jgi:hypothetical protein